jgi:hypothetical protein
VASSDKILPDDITGVNRCVPNSTAGGKFDRSRLTRCDYGWSTYPDIGN